MVVGYLSSINNLQPKTRAQHVSSLRQFCSFMFQFDPNTYIPENGLTGFATVQTKPHIFTENEIVKLIRQTKKLRVKHTLLPNTYATIISLLWVTGMRIGEVINLKLEDIDITNGIIHIKQTKFFKFRLIPLSQSSIKAIIRYKRKRAKFGYSEKPETPVFFNNRRKPCTTLQFQKKLKNS